MKKKLQLLLRSEGLIQSTKTIFGNTFATGLSAIALMFFSRILGPEKFGEFSVGFAIVLIITRINDSGLNTAILKYGAEKKTTKEKNYIYAITLKYKMLLSVVICTLGILFSEQLTTLLNFSHRSIVILSFTVGLATVYYEHLLNMLQSLHSFNQGILINIIQASTKLISALVLAMFNYSSSVISFILYIAAPIVPVFFWKSFLPKTTILKITHNDAVLKKQIIQIAKHSSVGLIAAGIIENVDVLYLQKYLSSYEVGLYSGVSRISLVFALAAYSLGNVLYPRVAQYKNQADIQAFIKKAFGIVFIAIIGFLFFIPFGNLSILLTIGSEYLPGLNILLILTAASFIAIAVIPFIALFFSFDANWYFSISGILQLAIVIIGNAFFVPRYGLEAAAWIRFITRSSLFLFTLLASLIIYKKTYGKSN